MFLSSFSSSFLSSCSWPRPLLLVRAPSDGYLPTHYSNVQTAHLSLPFTSIKISITQLSNAFSNPSYPCSLLALFPFCTDAPDSTLCYLRQSKYHEAEVEKEPISQEHKHLRDCGIIIFLLELKMPRLRRVTSLIHINACNWSIVCAYITGNQSVKSSDEVKMLRKPS
ncbi:hypothetical protein K435DRAFT_109141 [Dendrothele bispora CBS 962.96]|uniref:Uncharacterized protein n=1 Tax=Dendrothele bispora (strain CBS 962.96) TaxID=1314807 RepID=A0A4S8KND1_DENBC|nr:hypothetical protein K435DRAFT_109141 [Dendrothele bispora CBS 962.96]